jgi:hypothetical protein
MLIVSFDVGIKNLAYSLINFDKDKSLSIEQKDAKYEVLHQIELQEWCKIDLQSGKYDLENITKNLLEVLDNIAYNQIKDIHNETVHVVIENQPALKSPTMKSIQIVIYTYFNTIAKYNSLSLRTKLISAKSKLKYIESFTEFQEYMNEQANAFDGSTKKRIPKEKQGYAKNKNDSIQFTRWLLTNVITDEVHRLEMENMKKKDDICDSLLQGLYYINNL